MECLSKVGMCREAVYTQRASVECFSEVGMCSEAVYTKRASVECLSEVRMCSEAVYTQRESVERFQVSFHQIRFHQLHSLVYFGISRSPLTSSGGGFIYLFIFGMLLPFGMSRSHCCSSAPPAHDMVYMQR